MAHFFQSRIRSFGFAFKGLATLFRTQPNAWVHALAMLGVIGLAWYFQVSGVEWALLLLCITLVLAAEAFNTSIEFLTDLASPEFHPLAGHAKDVAAAAVLICSLGSVAVGLVILGPYLLEAIL